LTEEETMETGVPRVIDGEISLAVTLEEKLGDNEYIASDPEKGKLRKQVCYYLAQSPYVDVVLKKTGGLDDARWFKVTEILTLNFYDDILPIVTKAVDLLLKK